MPPEPSNTLAVHPGLQPLDYAAVRAIASPEKPAIPDIKIAAPDLRVYDRLLVEHPDGSAVCEKSCIP